MHHLPATLNVTLTSMSNSNQHQGVITALQLKLDVTTKQLSVSPGKTWHATTQQSQGPVTLMPIQNL